MSGFYTSNRKGWLFLKALLFCGASLSIFWSAYFAVATISIPYQIEYREGAALVMTGFLMNRSNPFILDNQPLAMNNYGLGYNAVVTPFAALLGNTLSIHRSVTFTFILLACSAGFILIYKVKQDAASGLTCAAFIMVALTAAGGIGAFPSAMGVFLFLMTILIPYVRRFDPAGLLWSVLFSLAAFYSKPYFVLGFGIVASFLFLFVSKKFGLLYSVFFLILWTLSFLAIRLVFPLYFLNTVIGNLSNTESSPAHLFSQLRELGLYFFPALISALLLMPIRNGSSRRWTDRMFIVRDWGQPLLGVSPDYFSYSALCALLAFILFLGAHIGAYLTYAYQLIVPLFFCWFFLQFDPQKKFAYVIAIAILLNLFFWGRTVLSPHMLQQEDSPAWESLSSYVRSSTNILNSPVVTSMVIESELNPLDSGQTAYFYSIEPYPGSALFGPFYEAFRADGIQYIKFIDNSIKKQRFDLVVTTVEKSTFYHTKLLDDFYVPVDQISIDMPQTDQQWTVLIWKPLVP